MKSIEECRSFGASRRRLVRGLALAASLLAAAVAPAAADVLLPDFAPFPESITSTRAGTLYSSSISDGGVVRVRPGSSEAEAFIKPGEGETRSTFGVLADEKTNTLWVCSNDASFIGLPGPSKVEGSYLKGFDLETGALKVSAPAPHKPSICNDIALLPDGTAIVSNVAQPELLRLKPGGEKLEVWLADPALKGGVDGLAFGPDGNLYVNTFNSGEFFRVDVVDGEAKKLTKLETSRPLTHPDGMRPYGSGFLMVEGAGPLSRVTISGDRANVETIKDFVGPTGVTLVGDTAWVCEGQLGYLFNPELKGKPRPQFHLRALPVEKK